jgi:hypothetical protein
MRVKKTKIREIEPLDFSLIKEPWGSSLANSTFTVDDKYLRTDGQRMAVADLDGWYTVVLHWVYKLKWDSRHKIPAPKTAVTQLKYWAEVMLAWLNLCDALYKIGYGQNYANEGEWFKTICWEYHTALLFGALNKTGGTGIFGRGEKRRIASIISSKKFANPFDLQIDPAQWEVARAIIETKDSRPDIFTNLWRGSQRQKTNKGLAAALSAWENMRPSATYGMQDGGVWVTFDENGRPQKLA